MIYLDYNATTPIAPEVKDAMLPFLEAKFGNPSSAHQFGVEAKKAVEKARKQVAELINCDHREIFFTSGGTESNNLALLGYCLQHDPQKSSIITSAIEHPAIMEVCEYLESLGFTISYLPVDNYGTVNVESLQEAIRPDTILISIMHSNNEIGTLQPIEYIDEIARENGICFHTDAAQSVGKVSVNVKKVQVDMLSIAGHKLYAPKGVGALYIKDGIKLKNIMFGAAQESGLRPGTENVPQIVGLGKACEIARKDLYETIEHTMNLRDKLHKNLQSIAPDLRLNGHPQKRLPNTLNVSFKNRDEYFQLALFAEIACSAGAACHSDEISISHVLQAIDIPEEYIAGTIRFSTGKFTDANEIDSAVEIVKSLLEC